MVAFVVLERGNALDADGAIQGGVVVPLGMGDVAQGTKATVLMT